MALNRIDDIDRGWNRIVANFRKMGFGPSVTVGIQGSEALASHEGGLTNAELMALHEFGSQDGTIPSRPALRGTADRERALFQRMLGIASKRIAIDGNVRRHLGVVGVRGVAEVRRTIDRSIGIVANKPATIAAKGSSTPLIDQGVLKGAITHEVKL